MRRLIIIGMVLCCLLAGCKKEAPKAQGTIFAMDTVMDLQVWGTDCEAAVTEITGLVNQLEADWSVTREDSLIHRLDTATLTDAQTEFLYRVRALQTRTNNFFDPTLQKVCAAWGLYTKNYRLPSAEDLHLSLEREEWDLGAAMKGYCGEQAVALLDTMDIEYAILDLGGNIQTYNNKPDGTPWKIGIQNPDGGDPLGVLSVTGTKAIVTSGDYQRCFTLEGKQYHHIIDPRTGYPAESGLRSVTVISSSGLTADCLSTALFVMGLDSGSDFWRESNDFEAVFVTTDGTVYATEGVSLSGCSYEVIRR